MKTTSESSKTIWEKFVYQVVGGFVFPTILLYKIAYWLMGKRCAYHWGHFDVTPLEPVTSNEYLFTRTLPATITLVGIGAMVGVGYLLGLPFK